MLVRRFSNTGQVHTIAAVLSIFAAIDVPIVYMSTRWYRTQHPAPVFFGDPGSGLDKSMKPAFDSNFIAWLFWGAFLVTIRYILERRRQAAEATAVQQALEATP